jgi:CubicO group peptidase (beta-lactamase class C family)
MQRPVLLAACLWLILGPVSGAPADEGPLAGLDAYIEKGLKDWETPGLAVAVVKDDKVVLLRGYGLRKLGESTPVDAHTLFAIGSISKSFTAASLGLLVDEGKIKWDDPVAQHLPGFRLHDAYANQQMTVRDLLSHRSGLDRHEYIWYGSGFSRADVLKRLPLLKPDWSFRAKFGYQNMMYLAAGEIIPAVTKKSWDEFVRERFFVPLGMRESNTSVTQFVTKNVATPHAKIANKVQPIAWRNIDNIGGAGAINSNVTDMARWVRLHLGDGKWDKKPLLSTAVVREMQTPQTVIRVEGIMASFNPHTHLSAYGLGWMISDYRDRKLVEHGGAIDGMTALVGLVPEEKLGIVILTNRSGSSLPMVVMYRIIDAYLKAPPRDWSGEFLKVIKGAETINTLAGIGLSSGRIKDTKPSHPLERYVGTYQSDLYPEVKVRLEKDHLVLQWGPSFTFDLEHWHYDTFRGTSRDRAEGKRMVTFATDSKGRVSEVRLAEASDTDLVFRRR